MDSLWSVRVESDGLRPRQLSKNAKEVLCRVWVWPGIMDHDSWWFDAVPQLCLGDSAAGPWASPP
jgi:hypothetical protein